MIRQGGSAANLGMVLCTHTTGLGKRIRCPQIKRVRVVDIVLEAQSLKLESGFGLPGICDTLSTHLMALVTDLRHRRTASGPDQVSFLL